MIPPAPVHPDPVGYYAEVAKAARDAARAVGLGAWCCYPPKRRTCPPAPGRSLACTTPRPSWPTRRRA
jgi:hypothetical protein